MALSILLPSIIVRPAIGLGKRTGRFWQIIAICFKIQNSIPSFDVPAYSIHVDNGVHASCPGNHQNIFNMFERLNSDDESLFSNTDDTEIGSPKGGTAV